jgi:antitoxin Phd
MKWQMQEAKARFSEVVERSLKEGPQTVTKHGKAIAVIIAEPEYRRLRRRKNAKEVLANGPPFDIDLSRPDYPDRPVDL